MSENNPLMMPTQADSTFPIGAGAGEDPREKPPKTDNIPEIIQVDREAWDKMQSDMAELRAKIDANTGIGFDEPTVPTCVVFKYKDNFVYRYGKSWEEKQMDGTYRLMMEVITVDNKGKEYVNQFDINNFRTPGLIDGVEAIRAKIIGKKQLAPTINKNGVTTLKDVKYDQFKTEDTGIPVPLTTTIPNDVMILELPDGSQIDLPTSAIN